MIHLSSFRCYFESIFALHKHPNQNGYRSKSDEIRTFLASRCSHSDFDRRFSHFPLIG